MTTLSTTPSSPTTPNNNSQTLTQSTPESPTGPGQGETFHTSILALTPNTPSNSSSVTIPLAQLEQILHSVLAHHAQPKAKDDNPLNQARLEHFVSQGTTLKFDGDQEKLVPWVKRFRSLRTNAVWQSATYVVDDTHTYDLLTEFTKVAEATIRDQATARWTPANQAKSLSQENSNLYYSRILGKVIINSVTDDFYTILQNYAGIELSNDGPLLLWLILSHFHTSTVTYTERLRSAIRARSLANDHKHDVEAYLLWLRLQLDILTTNLPTEDSSNKDLIEPIFVQLLTTSSKRLRRSAEDWHLAYHNNERKLTALSLVQLAERTCKALRCTGQLYIDNDPEIAVLHAKLVQQADMTTQAFNVITNTLKQTANIGPKKPHGRPTGPQNRPPKPDWFYKPPQNPSETHKHDGRTWHWCPKCGKDQTGKWVCTHTAVDHQNTFVRKRRAEHPNVPNKQPMTPTTTPNPTTPVTQANIAQLTAAHAQLTALIAQHPMIQLPALDANNTSPDHTSHDLLNMDDW
jgi:hypothetical protein